MSWGFFLYVIWFNPGQFYAFYALLQQQPVLLLAQNLASAIAEAVGYVGLILFVLRAPDGEPDRKHEAQREQPQAVGGDRLARRQRRIQNAELLDVLPLDLLVLDHEHPRLRPLPVLPLDSVKFDWRNLN